jgi:hypothetical protein
MIIADTMLEQGLLFNNAATPVDAGGGLGCAVADDRCAHGLGFAVVLEQAGAYHSPLTAQRYLLRSCRDHPVSGQLVLHNEVAGGRIRLPVKTSA